MWRRGWGNQWDTVTGARYRYIYRNRHRGQKNDRGGTDDHSVTKLATGEYIQGSWGSSYFWCAKFLFRCSVRENIWEDSLFFIKVGIEATPVILSIRFQWKEIFEAKLSSSEQILFKRIGSQCFIRPSFLFTRNWSFCFRSGPRAPVRPITSTNNVSPLLQRHTCFVCLCYKYYVFWKLVV